MAALLPAGSTTTIATILGLGLAGAALPAAVALVYRWYAGTRLPGGVGVLLGFTVVAIYLNTTAALGQVIAGGAGLFDMDAALLNTGTFALTAGTASAGLRFGDRLARSVSGLTRSRELDADVSRLVTTVGRVITVGIPSDIDDIPGYDPVEPATKETLAGKTLLFPRGLTVAELRDRLITRLKEDYRVGHVSLEMADDGTVEYLALGSRPAGIGPTLAPGTAATAIHADPPFSASSGDSVHVWTRDEEPTRVATAEVRATAGDVVTLALDDLDARELDPTQHYRLVTHPTTARTDREFASLLRDADETFGVAAIGPDSPLIGMPVSAIDPTVVALRGTDGSVEAIPPRSRTFSAGETIYAVAKPDALRRLEAAADGEAEPSS